MDNETLKAIARQLKQPSGEYAIQIGEKMNEGNLELNLNTIEALNPLPNDNILEIGMGNGFFVKDIISHASSIRYAGCDFSEIMVTEANKRNEAFVKSGYVQFFVAHAESLPFENETFTKVFTANTIYFWEDQSKTLSEIWRVLKPKGQLLISIRPKSVMEHYPFTRYGFTMFTKEELTGVLTANNFKVTGSVEKEEPDQEVSGITIKVKTLIVCGEK